tara:strand:- start:2614 stop:2865 length:252 start_codon:yes stop_codon:yes gene_type:complete
MESKKLLDTELQTLREYQDTINSIVVNLGKLDLQIDTLKRAKDKLFKEFQELEKNQIKTAQELQNKYGEGDIDLEKGEFTPTA